MSDFDLAFARLKRWRDGSTTELFPDDVKALIQSAEDVVEELELYRKDAEWRMAQRSVCFAA